MLLTSKLIFIAMHTRKPSGAAMGRRRMTKRHSYAEGFYRVYEEGARQSAKEIVPLILELIQPKRVIDVGCGIGAWLSVFKEFGVEDVWGVDGDWVDRKMLLIPEEQFLSIDLRKPFRMDKRFDLVVSLEVAEHLSNEYAETFVGSLTKLGPVILFSAAIPFQGGEHHKNEQWPEYWAGLFKENGYEAIDCIRKKIWRNDKVDWWYAQNIIMFARQDYLGSHPSLRSEFEKTDASRLSIVHPKVYLKSVDPRNLSLKRLVALLPVVVRNTLRRKR